MIRNQFVLDLHEELVVDNFAGGGGGSTGIERALGRCVDIAVNHDPEAIAMHQANHPQTLHLTEDVFQVDPISVTGGRRVGFGWFSPDCKHFSKAKGGKPRSKKIRGLAWVVVKWAMAFVKAGLLPPRVMMLENVEEFKTWGPLLRNGKPCPKGAARTFEAFKAILSDGISADHPDLPEIRKALGDVFDLDIAVRGLGYEVDSKELRASGYNTPTIRKRMYMIMRCDGRPIVWPAPTHDGPKSEGVKRRKLKPWRTAAQCIDWSLACPSIFDRTRPLAVATQRRIARGIRKFVTECAEPFVVKYHSAKREGDDRVGSIREPLPTQTVENRFAVAIPHITKFRTGSTGSAIDEPLHTITAGPKENPAGAAHAMGLVEASLAPILVRVAHGETSPSGVKRWGEGAHSMERPIGTISGSGEFAAVAATLVQTGYGEREGQAPRAPGLEKPLGTVVAGGAKHALVSATLIGAGGPEYSGKPRGVDVPAGSQTTENHAALVSAFLAKHFGGVTGSTLHDPVHTVTAVDHNALVTAQIVGCGGRMGQSEPRPVDAPVQTVTGKADSCLVATNLVRHFGASIGGAADEPVGTICAGGGGKTAVAVSHLSKLYGTTTGADLREPMHTVTSGGNHLAEVRAFLIKYYGNEKDGVSCREPMHTITAKHRVGLVMIAGEEYVITDIGMRMLEPHELYAAQGFPRDYIIAPMVPRRRGRKTVYVPLPKYAQVRMCGNSVCPPVAEALVLANVPELRAYGAGEKARVA